MYKCTQSFTLKGLWQELDYYLSLELDGVHVPLKVTQLMEKGRTYKFLAGLRSEFDHICSMVISRTPFPTLAEAFSAMRTEEMRRKAMPKERNMEASGMTARKDWKNSDKKKRDSKDDSWCDHCNKPRHDRANCWVLHGRPESKNKAKQVAAHVAETTT